MLRCVFNEHKGVDIQPLDIPSPGFLSHFKEEMGCASAEFLVCSVLDYCFIKSIQVAIFAILHSLWHCCCPLAVEL